jgi:tripartite-type tricarboxylate transporter receptor subunit TctC
MGTIVRDMLVAACLLLACGQVVAQTAAPAWPARAIRIVVPFPPGGSSDVIARLLAPRLSERYGQPVIVDNRPGGGGTVGADVVARAAPDGYSLLVGAAGALVTNPLLMPKLTYDPLRDFAPISLLVTSPFAVSVNPAQMPHVRTLRDLIAALKAKPGLTFASGGTGSGMHLAGELFRQMTGIDMTHVPYKGNGPALAGLAGGEVHMAFTDLGSTPPLATAGRIRVLAVASTRRSEAGSDVPTATESGVPGWEALGWFGLVAPAHTPAAIIDRLNAETVAFLRAPEMRERILATGNDPAPSTPAEFAAFIRTEHARWAKLIREAGIRLEP